MSKLIADIQRMLENRADIALYETSPTRLAGVQICRVWRQIIFNPDSMSPHERMLWHYYGQNFHIEEPQYKQREDGERELVKRQRDFAAKLGRVSSIVLFPKSIDDVLEVIGREPHDVDEYIRRQENKPRPKPTQPTPYTPGG